MARSLLALTNLQGMIGAMAGTPKTELLDMTDRSDCDRFDDMVAAGPVEFSDFFGIGKSIDGSYPILQRLVTRRVKEAGSTEYRMPIC